MTTLILLIIVNSSPSVTHIQFESEMSCLVAINKILDFEDKKKIFVKARCVKQ
jgi:hypothetical protein